MCSALANLHARFLWSNIDRVMKFRTMESVSVSHWMLPGVLQAIEKGADFHVSFTIEGNDLRDVAKVANRIESITFLPCDIPSDLDWIEAKAILSQCDSVAAIRFRCYDVDIVPDNAWDAILCIPAHSLDELILSSVVPSMHLWELFKTAKGLKIAEVAVSCLDECLMLSYSLLSNPNLDRLDLVEYRSVRIRTKQELLNLFNSFLKAFTKCRSLTLMISDFKVAPSKEELRQLTGSHRNGRLIREIIFVFPEENKFQRNTYPSENLYVTMEENIAPYFTI